MAVEMTPAVIRALEAARTFAIVSNAPEVEPLHVAWGLLLEEEGKGSLLAVRAGLDWSAYRSFVPQLPEDSGEDRTGTIEHSAGVRTVLAAARSIAWELLGESEAGSEALLLALVREDEAVGNFLRPLGLNVERLEEEFQRDVPPPLEMDEPLLFEDATRQIDLARIIDAAANRAREGLRVVEDYCRFGLDDAFLTGELKGIRHALTDALRELSPALLLQSRDTLADVGTSLSTDAEHTRPSVHAVILANFKRVQEALRSLEEYGKIDSPEAGARFEAIRYRVYTLERAVALGADARERLRNARLCVLLTGSQCSRSLEWTVEQAALGGADMIQMREKGLPDRELIERARQMRKWTRQAGVLFIVNDRPDVARLVEADGVHLGQDDLPVRDARRILGPDALIGVSTHDLEQLRRAVLEGASYVGVGPTFPSQTKDFTGLAGLDFVRAAAAETSLPAFAIGGINLKTIQSVRAAGARRIAVSHAVAASEDPCGVARALLHQLG